MLSLPIFLLTLGAVARVTRFITDDYAGRGIRMLVDRLFGPESSAAYLVRCPWCLSFWIALVALGAAYFWQATPAYWLITALLTISYLVGFVASFDVSGTVDAEEQ